MSKESFATTLDEVLTLRSEVERLRARVTVIDEDAKKLAAKLNDLVDAIEEDPEWWVGTDDGDLIDLFKAAAAALLKEV